MMAVYNPTEVANEAFRFHPVLRHLRSDVEHLLHSTQGIGAADPDLRSQETQEVEAREVDAQKNNPAPKRCGVNYLRKFMFVTRK